MCVCVSSSRFCKYVHYFPLFNHFPLYVLRSITWSLHYKFYWRFYYFFIIFENTFLINIRTLQNDIFLIPLLLKFKIYVYSMILDRHLNVFIINLRKFLFNVQLTTYTGSSICNCNILNIKVIIYGDRYIFN